MAKTDFEALVESIEYAYEFFEKEEHKGNPTGEQFGIHINAGWQSYRNIKGLSNLGWKGNRDGLTEFRRKAVEVCTKRWGALQRAQYPDARPPETIETLVRKVFGVSAE